METTTLTIRVDKQVKKKLDALAKFMSRSKAYLANVAIQDYLSNNAWLWTWPAKKKPNRGKSNESSSKPLGLLAACGLALAEYSRAQAASGNILYWTKIMATPSSMIVVKAVCNLACLCAGCRCRVCNSTDWSYRSPRPGNPCCRRWRRGFAARTWPSRRPRRRRRPVRKGPRRRCTGSAPAWWAWKNPAHWSGPWSGGTFWWPR